MAFNKRLEVLCGGTPPIGKGFEKFVDPHTPEERAQQRRWLRQARRIANKLVPPARSGMPENLIH